MQLKCQATNYRVTFMLIKLVACEWVFTNDSWTLNLFINSILNNAFTCYQADQLTKTIFYTYKINKVFPAHNFNVNCHFLVPFFPCLHFKGKYSMYKVVQLFGSDNTDMYVLVYEQKTNFIYVLS